MLVLAGGWVAAALFAYSHHIIRTNFANFDKIGHPLTVDHVVRRLIALFLHPVTIFCRKYIEVAVVVVAAIALCLGLLEAFIPWRSDLDGVLVVVVRVFHGSNSFSQC